MAMRTTRLVLSVALLGSALLASDTATELSPSRGSLNRTHDSPPISLSEGHDGPAILLADRRVLVLFEDLFRRAMMGSLDIERAAFLTFENGRFACLLWPASGDFRRESFEGAIPVGTVAIVHTHPNRIPKASPQDKATAKQTGLPLFTLTFANITMVDPGSGIESWPVRRTPWHRAVSPADSSGESACREIGAPVRKSRPESLLAELGDSG
jgi:hypothetical protein